MSRYNPDAHLPSTNAHFYAGSTPKAPLSGGDAEFLKGNRAAIVQPAVKVSKDWRYYENAIVHGQELTAALLKEYKDGEVWREHYKTWREACEPLGKSTSQIDRLIKEEREINVKCVNTAKEHTLATVNDLPDPFDLMPPTVHAGAAPMPTQSTPKPKAVQEEVEHKPRCRTITGSRSMRCRSGVRLLTSLAGPSIGTMPSTIWCPARKITILSRAT